MTKTVITIVGLGQIGTSIGLALDKHKESLQRVGHTRNHGQGNHAKKLGALDKVAINLPSAVRKADVVVLAIPMDEVKATLDLISTELKEGAVVLDTSPARQASSDWAVAALGEGCHYVGFTPVLNAQNLHAAQGGIEKASAQLFQDGMFAITSTIGTSSEALKVASDLATMMDAVPLFADVAEIDSYMSTVHVLPQLLAASMANITVESPGWSESRKLAGRPYAQLTNLIASIDSAGAVALSAQLNKEHVLRAMDQLIEELKAMRSEIEDEDDTDLNRRIQRASESRKHWWTERQISEWLTEKGGKMDFAEAGNPFGQLFGFNRAKRKKDQ